MSRQRPRIAVVTDPRFPGGTASAIAHELRALAPYVDYSVHGVDGGMFRGTHVSPALQAAIDEIGLDLTWGDPVISAPVVVLHNPSFLKLAASMPVRITCGTLIVVSHENFLLPNGEPAFDVNKCLEMIDARSVCGRRVIAPVSGLNRAGVQRWHSSSPVASRWEVAPFDWFNICEFEIKEPNPTPADRRGRMSRPGFEKFPDMQAMAAHFPAHAECHIMGGDTYLLDTASVPSHWSVLPFRAEPVSEFLDRFDFFVYFTARNWRESFGRVIAEAIAAGKVVITDAETGATFGDSVVVVDGSAAEIDVVIGRFVADPASYVAFVKHAQAGLRNFGADTFRSTVLAGLQTRPSEKHHAVL